MYFCHEILTRCDVSLFPTQRRGNRMAVRDVTRQLTEATNMDVSQEEIVDALRRMEADGVVQFNERAQSIFVRVGIMA